jgi:hypothetical protein
MSPEQAALNVEHARKHLQIQLMQVRDILGIGLIPQGAAEDMVRTISILIEAKIDQRLAAVQPAPLPTP